MRFQLNPNGRKVFNRIALLPRSRCNLISQLSGQHHNPFAFSKREQWIALQLHPCSGRVEESAQQMTPLSLRPALRFRKVRSNGNYSCRTGPGVAEVRSLVGKIRARCEAVEALSAYL
jgi:hypothetical protein